MRHLHSINDTDTILDLYCDSDFDHKFRSSLRTITEKEHHKGNRFKQEHSFEWVHDELDNYFPNASLFVVAPNRGVKRRLSQWTISFVKTHPKTLVIGTTDLIHYGDQYGTTGSLGKNVQSNKEELELSFIGLLTSPTPNLPQIQRFIEQYPMIACGSKAVIELSKITKGLGLKGEMVDYYDSRRYDNSESFVSYVSIVYSKYLKRKSYRKKQ